MDGARYFDKTVDLFYVGELNCITEIKTHLIGCGFTVTCFEWEKIQNSAQNRDSGDIVVFVFGSNMEYTEEQNLLQRMEIGSPKLAIFCTGQAAPNEDILKHCDDFLYWPCRKNELRQRITRILQASPRVDHVYNDDGLLSEFGRLNIFGRSRAFWDSLRMTKKIASCDAHVLIKGDTGTGKELIARAIHRLSQRGEGPFVALNCGAITDTLIESVLFGHERGAFTDAKRRRPGVVEQAQGGTLFLDEINSLSLKAQVSLLRFLQELEYTPIGGERKISADVRVISATNANLHDLVSAGCFRLDLLYRLEVMTLELPSLQERMGDIELLAQHFLNRFKSQYNKPNKRFHHNAMQNMKSYAWPGNVRELENRIHREFLLSDGDTLHMQLLTPKYVDRRKSVLDRRISSFYDANYQDTKSQVITDFERRYLCWIMSETNGNVTRAAQRIGKERRALGKLLKKYNIDKSQFQLSPCNTRMASLP